MNVKIHVRGARQIGAPLGQLMTAIFAVERGVSENGSGESYTGEQRSFFAESRMERHYFHRI